MAKNNIRSFRYSDEVASILEAQAGDNLNEKFDNLIRYCFERVPWVEKRLADLEIEIEQKRKMLQDVHNQVDQIEMMMNELKKIQFTVELVARRAKNIAEENL